MLQLERIYSSFAHPEGPVYGELKIIHGGLEFYIIDADNSEEYVECGLPVRINNHSYSALPIAQFGFILEDFKDVPLNKYGLKEVANFRNEKLVVTANALFVLYSHGIPSMVGLPSEITNLSGVWVDEVGTLKFPKHSVHSEEVASAQFLMATQASFREIPLEAINLLRYTTRKEEQDSLDTNQSLCFCDHCLGGFTEDIYKGLYKGLKNISVDWVGESLSVIY